MNLLVSYSRCRLIGGVARSRWAKTARVGNTMSVILLGLCHDLALAMSGWGALPLHSGSSDVNPRRTGQEVSLVADLGSRWPMSASGDRVSTLVRLALTSRQTCEYWSSIFVIGQNRAVFRSGLFPASRKRTRCATACNMRQRTQKPRPDSATLTRRRLNHAPYPTATWPTPPPHSTRTRNGRRGAGGVGRLRGIRCYCKYKRPAYVDLQR